MKKRILLITLIGMSFGIKAQEKIQTEIGLKNDFIYKNGNIGIGINNPTFDLDISSSNSNIRLKNTSPSNWAYLRIHGSGSKLWDIAQYGDNDFLEFRPNGSSTNRIVFNKNGNIGLGITNPTFDLDISSSNSNIRLKNTNPSSWAYLRIHGSGSKLWDIAQYGDNDFLEFRPNGSSTNRIVFNKNGNIGLGITNPTFDLDISSSNSNIRLKNTSPSNWAYLRIHGSGSKLWDIAQYGDNDFLEFRPNGSTATVIFKQNGNVAIQGKLEAKEIKVILTPTADFVFNEFYKLPTLDFIENFVKKNKHLPEIASAKEMKDKGVNIGNFQIQLLQKIEELTLYTIAQEKKIEKIQKENTVLKTINLKLIELQKRLEKLEEK